MRNRWLEEDNKKLARAAANQIPPLNYPDALTVRAFSDYNHASYTTQIVANVSPVAMKYVFHNESVELLAKYAPEKLADQLTKGWAERVHTSLVAELKGLFKGART